MPSIKNIHFYGEVNHPQNDAPVPNSTSVEHHRDKRAAGLIFLGFAAALGAAGIGTGTTAMAVAERNELDIQYLKNAQKYVVSAIETNDANIQELNERITALDSILKNTYAYTTKILSALESTLHMNNLEDGVTTLISEIDSELFKLALAIKDSLISRLASNFLLSDDDLQLLARMGQKVTKKSISTDFFSIRVTMCRDNNNIILLIEAPVTPEDSEFKFYEFIPVPIFKGNLTFVANTESKFIAINNDHTEYALYDHIPPCVSTSSRRICQDDLYPIAASYLGQCPTELFTNLDGKCSLIETSTRDIFLMRSGRFIVYSTPDELTFTTQCKDSFDNTPITKRDFGVFEVNSTCTCIVSHGHRQFRFPGKHRFTLAHDTFIHQIVFLTDNPSPRIDVTYERPDVKEYRLQILPRLRNLFPETEVVSRISKGSVLAIICVIVILMIIAFFVFKYRGSLRRVKKAIRDAAEYIQVQPHTYTPPPPPPRPTSPTVAREEIKAI